jgi:hypothetical protein
MCRFLFFTKYRSRQNGVFRAFSLLGKLLAIDFWELGMGGQSKRPLGHNVLKRNNESYSNLTNKPKSEINCFV